MRENVGDIKSERDRQRVITTEREKESRESFVRLFARSRESERDRETLRNKRGSPQSEAASLRDNERLYVILLSL